MVGDDGVAGGVEDDRRGEESAEWVSRSVGGVGGVGGLGARAVGVGAVEDLEVAAADTWRYEMTGLPASSRAIDVSPPTSPMVSGAETASGPTGCASTTPAHTSANNATTSAPPSGRRNRPNNQLMKKTPIHAPPTRPTRRYFGNTRPGPFQRVRRAGATTNSTMDVSVP